MSFVEIRSVSKTFGPVKALDGVSLSVERGSRMVVVGPSGCGKTTLLRLIAGFEVPDAGSIVIGGDAVADGPAIVPAHRRNIGIVAQDGCLFPHLTVAGNITFGMTEEKPAKARRAAELMEMVGLAPSMLERRPDALSGGQQQRVALARALARKPRLMLLDEPFSALDTGLRATTRKAVGDILRAEGIATLLVTHDQAEALAFADRIAVMRSGRLAQVGSPREVYARPADPQTAAFLGEAIVLSADISNGFADCALGRLPVDDQAASGRRTVMLRPEQIVLLEAASGEGVPGRIADVSFCGSSSDVRIVLVADESIILSVDVPSTCSFLPAQAVQLQVLGTAHVFL